MHAFSGASGVGKSTLAAALGRHGLPFFADDLLLDPASFGEGCLYYRNAGLKLFPDAPVYEGVRKRWARPAHRSPRFVDNLRTLHLLSYRDGRPGDATSCSIEPLTRWRVVIALYETLYRRRQALAIVGRRRLLGWLLTAAARQVQVSIFHRPKSKLQFEQGVAHLAAALAEVTSGFVSTGSTN